MGQVLHGSARTTAAVRRAIQHSQESLNCLSARYGINPKTVAKWRKRESTQDAPVGPASPTPPFLLLNMKLLWLPFASTRCCRWMTASMRSRPPSPC